MEKLCKLRFYARIRINYRNILAMIIFEDIYGNKWVIDSEDFDGIHYSGQYNRLAYTVTRWFLYTLNHGIFEVSKETARSLS